MASVARRPKERVRQGECRRCGAGFTAAATGRARVYCSSTCRRRDWELRQAEDRVQNGDTGRPEVIREVVERTTYYDRPVYRRTAPSSARDWREELTALTEQLADPNSPVVLEHYEHERLARALQAAWAALDRAHPGGLHRRR